MTGLLLALSDPPPGREDDYERWYEQHTAARAAVPGIDTARRYWVVDGEPSHLGAYDLSDVDVLQSPAYTSLREERPEGEEEMLDALPEPMDRRVYRAVGEEMINDGYSPERSTHLLAVWMTLEDGHEQDLADWYTEEHVPMLFKVEGWLRTRRFELVDGGGPRFVALHDLSTMDGFFSPPHEAARHTPWRDRIVAAQTDYERRTYRLHKAY